MSSTSERHAYNEAFDKAYLQLNDQQRGAVEAINGPVMALAGPGTGKTQLLAVRIGYILRKTDTKADEILALTFTDAGAFAMRQRLRQFIGPEANRITVATFHSFCSQVIADHSDYFGEYRELELVSDLEIVDILRKIIEKAPIDSPIRKLKGKPYQNLSRIKELFGTMKREHWTADDMKKAVADMADRARGHLVAGRKTKSTILPGVVYEKGDVREDKIQQEVEGMEGIIAAAEQLDTYNAILDQRGLYDYNDMINWVLKAFQTNETLLSDYQERYQYLLVDEYQDTNRSQNKLVETLASYWEEPNLFVVGDDDQSIYRFQGAEMANINAFIKRFNPQVHVLTQNYRSNQNILDRATNLITVNGDSRIAQKHNVPKTLTASHPDKKGVPNDAARVSITAYANKTQEEAGTIQRILDLHKQGVAYSDIAVLYTKHAQATDIIRYLTQKGIPVNVKKRVNVLDEIDVRRLLTILEYIETEYKSPHSGQHLLFELLHFDFFGLEPRDIGRISVHCRHRYKDEQEEQSDDKAKQQPYWRDVMQDETVMTELGVADRTKMMATAQQIESWISATKNYTLQILFEKVLTESGLLYEILSSGETSWRLQVVNTLFDFIKNESAKIPTLSLTAMLDMIGQMQEENIDLQIMRVTSATDAVNFMTIHSSKGLEFDHVMIIGCHEKNWEKKRGNSFNYSYPQLKFPENDVEKTVTLQELRRLLFVGITRAADYCYISYGAKDDSGKDRLASQFIGEAGLDATDIEITPVPVRLVDDYQSELLKYHAAKPQLIDHDLIDRVLAKFRMSSTSLNKYLNCPTTFYYENILRVPSARTTYIGYGNAVHYALEMYNIKQEKDNMEDPGLDFLLSQYIKGLEKYRSHFTDLEFQNIRHHGRESLTNYYEDNRARWAAPRSVKAEYKVAHTEYEGVPISGTIDRLEVYDDRLVMIDYKTGAPANASKKVKPPKEVEDLGGDYWRQIFFYYLLLKGEGRFTIRIDQGVMSYVEQQKNGKYRNDRFEMDKESIATVSKQLVQAYADILEHKFDEGCKDSDCKWCTFVSDNTKEALLTTQVIDEDDARQHIEL